uniref:Uncharacterized protein n=1 Tax=Ananas comosus var. bracteatus TaxID=296719 RepID=A0A6V7QD81_ANACO|nr:unnamed protein product [Ananas comosus var. bracteatus]
MDAAAEHGGADGDAAAAAATVAAMGAYGGAVRAAESAAEEILLLWALRQPTAHRHNAFVRHSAQTLTLDACGRHLSILQSPSAMCAGRDRGVMWDSGVVLGKFLEHAVDSGRLLLRGRRAVELGAGAVLLVCVLAHKVFDRGSAYRKIRSS